MVLACFKPHLPVFAVEIAIYDCPKDVSTTEEVTKREEERNCQRRQLGEFRFVDSPQAGESKKKQSGYSYMLNFLEINLIILIYGKCH